MVRNVSCVPTGLVLAAVTVTCWGDEGGRLADELLRDLQSKQVDVKLAAIDRISRLGKHASATVPGLLKALNDRDHAIRVAAARAILEIDQTHNKDVLECLLHVMRAKGRFRTSTARLILLKIDPKCDEALFTALEGIDDPASGPRTIWDIGTVAKQNPIAVRLLSGILDDPLYERLYHITDSERLTAASALRDLGPVAKDAVPALAHMLTKDDYGLCATAAHALGNIGKEAKPAVPALIKALQGTRNFLPFDAAGALIRIEPEHAESWKMLEEGLASSNYEVQIKAARQFIMDPLVPKAVPYLVKTLRSETETVRMISAISLAKARTDLRIVIPALEAALKDPSARVRAHAVSALGEIGQPALPVLPEILKARQDESYYVRARAEKAVHKLKGLQEREKR